MLLPSGDDPRARAGGGTCKPTDDEKDAFVRGWVDIGTWG